MILHNHTHTQFLSLVFVVMIKSRKLETKIYHHAHSLILTHEPLQLRYIKGGFNKLDLVVVISAWPSILMTNFISMGPLRAFRVLRVLKQVNHACEIWVVDGHCIESTVKSACC